MSPENTIQDAEAINRKLADLRSMLEAAKSSETAQPLIPLIESAIEAHEDRLRNLNLRVPDAKRKPGKNITLRATHLDTWAKDRHCVGVYYPVDDHYVFELEQTQNWFRRSKFLPRDGFLLIPEDSSCQFEITGINYLSQRPKKAVFTAIPARAV